MSRSSRPAPGPVVITDSAGLASDGHVLYQRTAAPGAGVTVQPSPMRLPGSSCGWNGQTWEEEGDFKAESADSEGLVLRAAGFLHVWSFFHLRFYRSARGSYMATCLYSLLWSSGEMNGGDEKSGRVLIKSSYQLVWPCGSSIIPHTKRLLV